MGKKSLRRELSPARSFCEGRSPDLPEQHQATLKGEEGGGRGGERGGRREGRKEGGEEGGRGEGAPLPIQSVPVRLAPPLAPGTTSYPGCMIMSAHTDEGWNENKSVSFDLNSSVAIKPAFLMEPHNSRNKILARMK